MGRRFLANLDKDFNTLQTETEVVRVTLERLTETSEEYLKAVSKRFESTDKHKGLAIETFGMSMSTQAQILPEGWAYRDVLCHMGDAHQKIGAAQSEMNSRFAGSYMLFLEKEHAHMKKYQRMQRKLHSRRQDYDAKLAKVQKAKKEKPEWEEELQLAKTKYEDTRECVLEMMMTIVELQDEAVQNLKVYYDAQLACARKTVEILEAIPGSIFITHSNGSPTSPHTPHSPAWRQSLCDTDDDHSNHSDDHSGANSVSTTPRPVSVYDEYHQINFQPPPPDLRRSISHPTPTRVSRHRCTLSPGSSSAAPQLPVLPEREPRRKQVRAIYDFNASAGEELSLHKGDLVRVIEEIDEGWWEGELIDSNGVRHVGMFPSNYVEEVPCDAVSELHQTPLKSNPSSPSYCLDEEEAAYYQRGTIYSEPEQELAPEAPVINIPAVRRAHPLPSPHSSVSAVEALSGSMTHTTGSSHGHLPSRQLSLDSSKLVGTRTPPPPPLRRTNRDSPVFNNRLFSSPTTTSPPSMSPNGGFSGMGSPKARIT
ncbi:hypothetical protein BGZ80_008550 [Entomortierella chlamydospora]|uniref:BAR-domain-containing protein n=1 Tax=Entomortierella chlamydospora TaxID=101097 RepID=A0A9P6MX56_9FUNG|nr:hypothetical protein BGZ79_004749 [Entomortierella chlamydospora]KAG0017173.1 hypothetical protein BGZ80_008550 [Entomortierella chlamydospora]